MGKSGRGLNVLINIAAFAGTSEMKGFSFFKISQTSRSALEVTLPAVLDISRVLTPMLKVVDGASIINVVSIYGMYVPARGLHDGTSMSNLAPIGASKGGLN